MSEKAAQASTGSFVSRGKGYFSDSLRELQKVQSPTRQETVKLTWVVLMIIVFISLCLFAMDYAFSSIMQLLIGGEIL